MPPSELIALYESTQYRVRLARGGYGIIRIGQPLPEPVLRTLPRVDTPWAFVTAWNPRSRVQPTTVNRSRQHELLAILHRQRPPVRLIAGVGVGEPSRWREPSLFVAGIPLETLDRLMQPFRQHAIVRGLGAQPAQLHWLD